MTSSDSIHELRWRTRSQASRMAWVILGWLCPIVEQIWPLVKSRYLFPSWSQIHDPSARLTTNGANSEAYRIRCFWARSSSAS
jgi:hypothetical protein